MMKKKIGRLLIIIIVVIILAFFVIIWLNNKVMPIYMNYSESEMKRLVTTVINKSVGEELTNQFDTNELFIIKSSNEKITMVDFDPVIVNRVMSSVSNIVYDNLKLISEKNKETLEKFNVSESIFYIPTGVIFDSVLLNNLGPKIPLNLELISSVNPDIKTKVTEYGINNSLIEVYIQVNASVKMVLPSYSKEMEIVVVVPLCVKLIQGDVPEYYQGGLGFGSSLFFSEN